MTVEMGQKEIVISPMDLKHLEVIRKSVSDFMARCAGRYDQADTLLLDVAPQIYLGAKEFFRRTQIKTLDINPDSKADYIADLCRNNSALIPSGNFDFVVCTEVLEHTLQPFHAVDEIERILKQDGLVFLTVPFNFRIHGPLPDCWRFTEHGLRALFKNFRILELQELPTEGRDLMPIHYQLVAAKQ